MKRVEGIKIVMNCICHKNGSSRFRQDLDGLHNVDYRPCADIKLRLYRKAK